MVFYILFMPLTSGERTNCYAVYWFCFFSTVKLHGPVATCGYYHITAIIVKKNVVTSVWHIFIYILLKIKVFVIFFYISYASLIAPGITTHNGVSMMSGPSQGKTGCKFLIYWLSSQRRVFDKNRGWLVSRIWPKSLVKLARALL